MAGPVLTLSAIEQTFFQGDKPLHVLKGADVDLHSGEISGLLGPSGAGKSTLLHIAGLLEKPSGGVIRIDGRECGDLPDRERTLIRRDRLGFVYQFHHLLPEFSALENVAMPLIIAGTGRRPALDKARAILEKVGLAERLHHTPSRLSGGEQQRVAIARGLANDPVVLLADEPTGNLDEQTADSVFDLLLGIVRERGVAALIATHNKDLARRMDRRLILHDGRVQDAGADNSDAGKS